MPKVICQKWLESEAGWGTRPDGYTLHLTEAHRVRFVAEFWRKQKEHLGEETPPEYTREDGEPYECPVTRTIYLAVQESGDGIAEVGGSRSQRHGRTVAWWTRRLEAG